MSEKKKYLYLFSEGNKDMREILGGKGANLAEMTNAGMPVPQGFTANARLSREMRLKKVIWFSGITEPKFTMLAYTPGMAPRSNHRGATWA